MRTRAQQDLSSLHSMGSVQALAQQEASNSAPAADVHSEDASDSESDYDSDQYRLAKRLRTALGFVQPRAVDSAEPDADPSDEEGQCSLPPNPAQVARAGQVC